MVKIKTKEELSKYIEVKLSENRWNQMTLAKKISLCKFGVEDGSKENTINTVKYNVSKWIKGERYPGTDYVYYLAQVLEVSIEELLLAGEVCSKYDNRPFSLYAVAKSGNVEQLDKLMHTFTPDGTCVGENYDEYDKTILDYIIEFENMELLHYLIDNNYMHFDTNQVSTTIRIGGQYSFAEMYEKIVQLAIKYDDLKLFQKAISRVIPIFRKPKEGEASNCFTKTVYNVGYMLTEETILSILETKEIKDYLCLPFVASEDEWRRTNQGIIFRDENSAMKSIQRLSASFNNILDLAYKVNHNKLLELKDIALNHNVKTMQEVNETYASNEYKISEDGVVCPGRVGIGCLTVLGVLNGVVLGERE